MVCRIRPQGFPSERLPGKVDSQGAVDARRSGLTCGVYHLVMNHIREGIFEDAWKVRRRRRTALNSLICKFEVTIQVKDLKKIQYIHTLSINLHLKLGKSSTKRCG